YSFDISWVDQATQTYYLADRSNNVIDVVDAKTGAFVGQIPGGFKGVAVGGGVVQGGQSGPNGVTTGGHCLFVTDAPSRVVRIDRPRESGWRGRENQAERYYHGGGGVSGAKRRACRAHRWPASGSVHRLQYGLRYRGQRQEPDGYVCR